ncbi:VTT domain-containing protein [Liquorilactobacillus sicerae]|uniref:VTT domain-containing protein n=1 Tax=Liquorilactobacillus sicerae TaxID=1416943 RepID=UPI002480CB84|nr:VTT domain-containing protein [Liquorilactobacillus sicerae]
MNFLIDFIFHIDDHLVSLINTFGNWTYLILFLIIFIETGAVILPFLPGDSLLFAASALAANANYHLEIWLLVAIFWTAPLLGDGLNFKIGQRVGDHITPNSFLGRFIKETDLTKTRNFFERHGALAISLARFMPIIRTLAPFIAGSSGMPFMDFFKYNFMGATAWMALCCSGGFFFGNLPFVQEHFSLIIIGIILVSLLPAAIGALKHKLS